eukprot:SAG31_NODE_515_length_14710_cov_6.289097_5_plen_69_part_00
MSATHETLHDIPAAHAAVWDAAEASLAKALDNFCGDKRTSGVDPGGGCGTVIMSNNLNMFTPMVHYML